MKLVITSHGDLCTGLVSSLNMIAGENKDVFTVKLTDAGIGEYTKNLHSLLDELIKEDSVLILADLKGGTPYNQSYSYTLEHPEKTRVVYGVNLPMVIETSMMMNVISDLDELANVAVNAGVSAVGTIQLDDSDEDDDDDLF